MKPMERGQHTSRSIGGDIRASSITTVSETAACSATPLTAGVYAIDSMPSHLLPQVVSVKGCPQQLKGMRNSYGGALGAVVI